jgi:hypothetical protein
LLLRNTCRACGLAQQPPGDGLPPAARPACSSGFRRDTAYWIETDTASGEPIHAAPETNPAPAQRNPRAKTAKKAMSLDTVEPTAPKPRARKPKAAAPVETPGD